MNDIPHSAFRIWHSAFIAAVLLCLGDCPAGVTAGIQDDSATHTAAADPDAPEQSAEWIVDLPAPPAAGGVADADRIYVPVQGAELVALDRESGAIVWSRQLDSAWPPVRAGTSLWIGTSDSLVKLDPATGATLTRIELPEAPAGPFTQAGDLLLVPLASGTLRAVRTDGAVAWHVALGAPSRLAPVAGPAADAIYVSLTDGRLISMARDTGDVRWSRSIEGTITAPVPAGDRVFVGSTGDRASLLAFDTDSGRLAWHWLTGNNVIGVDVDDRRVFVVSLDNMVRALDQGSGNLRWQQVMRTRPLAAPFRVGTRLFVPGVRPALLVYETARGAHVESLAVPPPLALSVLTGPLLVLPHDPSSRVDIVAITSAGSVIGFQSMHEAGTQADPGAAAPDLP